MTWRRVVARTWNAVWFRNGSRHNLAAARILIAAHALWILLSRDLASISGIPEAFWAQVPWTREWRFLLFHGHPGVEHLLQGLAVVALAAVVLGIVPRLSCLVAGLLLYHLAPLESVYWIGSAIERGFEISILALIVFFVLGLVFLLQLRGRKLREEPAAPASLPPPPASAVFWPTTRDPPSSSTKICNCKPRSFTARGRRG